MLEKLAELVARADQQVGVTVHVDDEVDCFKENGILGIGMLNFLRLRRLLCLVQYCLNALYQPVPDCRVIYRTQQLGLLENTENLLLKNKVEDKLH